jgi:alkylation response protein AidB-like acyl-CoA dehydrogenase
MHFALSDEQTALREVAAAFLAELPGPLSMTEQGQDYDPAVWDRIVEEQGWPAIPVPEDVGGWGFGLLDLAVVFEEVGRAMTPCPLFATSALAIPAVAQLGGPEQQARLLEPLLTGGTGTLALSASVTAERDGDWHHRGTARRVVDGHSAQTLVVPTSGGVFVLDSGWTATRVASLDTARPLSDLAIDAVVPDDRRLVGTDLTPAHQRAAVLAAAESVGAAEACLDTAVDYARVREQFGQAIGRFQAIQHLLADVMVAVETARAATWYAATALDQERDDAALAVATAKALASDALFQAAGQSIQVHGGVGFTWEHTAHMYFKRARAMRDLLGSPTAHRDAVADAILGRL